MSADILIVDDDREVAKSLKRVLSRNYDCIFTDDIADIDEILRTNKIALVVLDQDLKQERLGTEIARELKREYPLIQLIMFTGNTDYDLLKNIINTRDIDGFMNKPIIKEDINDIIDRHYDIAIKNRGIYDDMRRKIHDNELAVMDLDRLAGYPAILERLLLDMIQIRGGSVRLIGYGVTHNDELLFDEYREDLIVVKDHFLFSRFIAAIQQFKSSISGADVRQIINLGDFKVVIQKQGDYVFSFFFANLEHGVEETLDEYLLHQCRRVVELIKTSKVSRQQVSEILFEINE